jgi:hypothetical protein
MTGTKQLLGHLHRQLDLLWQMLNLCRPTPTNITSKKPLRKSITGSQAFVFERNRPSLRSLNSSILNQVRGRATLDLLYTKIYFPELATLADQ